MLVVVEGVSVLLKSFVEKLKIGSPERLERKLKNSEPLLSELFGVVGFGPHRPDDHLKDDQGCEKDEGSKDISDH